MDKDGDRRIDGEVIMPSLCYLSVSVQVQVHPHSQSRAFWSFGHMATWPEKTNSLQFSSRLDTLLCLHFLPPSPQTLMMSSICIYSLSYRFPHFLLIMDRFIHQYFTLTIAQHLFVLTVPQLPIPLPTSKQTILEHIKAPS